MFFRQKRAVLIISTASMLLAVCTTTDDAPTIPANDVQISGSIDGAPAQCAPQDVMSRLTSLYNAFNRADRQIASEYFDNSSFQWYCMDMPGQPQTLYTVSSLNDYFMQRYAQHEHIRLVSIQFTGWDEARGLVHFGPFQIERTADDIEPSLLWVGKGAYQCSSQTFVVLCVGGQ